MDDQQKEELVARFRHYLDHVEESGVERTEDDVDLFTLFTELAGLKSEVRLESRQFKSALEEFRGVFATLDSANQDMAAHFGALQKQDDRQEEIYLKPMVLGLMEIHDRLSDALAQEEAMKTDGGFSFFCRRLARRYRAHIAGLQMLLERVHALLALCHVQPVETMGRKFDPRMMKAVDFCTDNRHEPGTVCAQQRTGFVWNGRVIRPAEVIVAKDKG